MPAPGKMQMAEFVVQAAATAAGTLPALRLTEEVP
jgi:hypothetical protein